MTAVCHQGMKAVVKNSLMLSSQGEPENSSAGLVTHCRQCCGKWLLHRGQLVDFFLLALAWQPTAVDLIRV